MFLSYLITTGLTCHPAIAGAHHRVRTLTARHSQPEILSPVHDAGRFQAPNATKPSRMMLHGEVIQSFEFV
jgi:hypothetical protein